MTYLVIGAVAFAIGLRLGYWFGKDDGYHLACHDCRVKARYQDIIRAAKASAERN